MNPIAADWCPDGVKEGVSRQYTLYPLATLRDKKKSAHSALNMDQLIDVPMESRRESAAALHIMSTGDSEG